MTASEVKAGVSSVASVATSSATAAVTEDDEAALMAATHLEAAAMTRMTHADANAVMTAEDTTEGAPGPAGATRQTTADLGQGEVTWWTAGVPATTAVHQFVATEVPAHGT